jgi:polysaccharide export outer membrane protein
MCIKIIKTLALCTILATLGACSSNTLPSATAHQSLTTSVDNYNYLVGPGDGLNIFVWRNPDVSGSFIVRPDGKITTSLVEDIAVSGKTPNEIARLIEQELGKFIRDPIVTVSLNEFSGPFSEQVRVIGAATNPQAISYRENMTLLDLMIAVGGLNEFANGNGAKLIRVVNGEQKEYKVKIARLIKNGDIDANIDLLPGDIIIIPEAWF